MSCVTELVCSNEWNDQLDAICVGFQSYPGDLSTEDKISLCIAEKYLDFKASTLNKYFCNCSS